MKEYIINIGKGVPKIVIVGILFVIACGFAGQKIYQYSEEGSVLMTQLFEMNSLVSSKKTWEDRADWIKERIPRFNTQSGAANYLLQSLGHSLSDHGLTLASHEFHGNERLKSAPPEKSQNFDRATIGITIKGSERDIVEWIHEIQSSGKFTGVDHLAMELDDYGLICRLKISQWYLGANRSFNLSEHHESKIHDLDAGLVEGF